MPVRVQSPEGLAPIPFAFEEQQGGFRQVPSFHLTDRVSDPGPRCCNKLGDYLTCFGYLPRAFQYLFGWDDCCRSCFHRSSTRVRVGSHYKKHWTRSIRALLSMPVYRNLLGGKIVAVLPNAASWC